MNQIRSSIDDDVNSFIKEAHDDYVGFWQILRRAKARLTNADAMTAEVFDIVRALLERGLLAGNLTKDGGFEPWGNQQPDAVLSRVRQEWRDLGGEPTIDDIAWFHLPR